MTQGGYRRPSGGPKAPGVGRNAQRTDTQPINVPNVGDSTDLVQGDRQKLEASQRSAPIGRAASPTMTSPPGAGTGGSGATPSEIPGHIFDMPSDRPLEDPMAPASPPPDAPQNDAEVVLMFLIGEFNDDKAAKMLDRIRVEAQQVAQPPQMPSFPVEQSAPEAQMGDGEPAPMVLQGDEEEPAAVVEEEVPIDQELPPEQPPENQATEML